MKSNFSCKVCDKFPCLDSEHILEDVVRNVNEDENYYHVLYIKERDVRYTKNLCFSDEVSNFLVEKTGKEISFDEMERRDPLLIECVLRFPSTL